MEPFIEVGTLSSSLEGIESLTVWRCVECHSLVDGSSKDGHLTWHVSRLHPFNAVRERSS